MCFDWNFFQSRFVSVYFQVVIYMYSLQLIMLSTKSMQWTFAFLKKDVQPCTYCFKLKQCKYSSLPLTNLHNCQSKQSGISWTLACSIIEQCRLASFMINELNNSLHLVGKYAQIFVRGPYRLREGKSFARTALRNRKCPRTNLRAYFRL